MRLDHSGKDVTKGQRGGSAKVGDVDAVWRMSAVTETKFRLECEAHRFPVGEPVLIIDRHLHPLRHTPDTGGQGSATEAKRAKIIATLDALEVPRDASRTVARKALEGSGLTMSHDAYKIIQEMRQTALQTWLATA